MKRITRRLHKWIGIISSLFIFFVAITAIMLNHQDLYKGYFMKTEAAVFSPEKAVALEVDPFNPNHLVASDFKALFHSTDSGKTWTEIKLFVPSDGINNIAFAPSQQNKFYISKKETGIYVTDDGGDIWDEPDLPFYAPEGEYIEKLSAGNDGTLTIKTKYALYTGNPEENNWITVDFSKNGKAEIIGFSEFVYNLHTGKLFGSYGIYIYDILSVGLIFLAVSGLFISIRPGKRKKSFSGKPLSREGEVLIK